MKVKEIGTINEALLVLRHFIDLSARLLPFLEELQKKEKLDPLEVRDKERIIEVYSSYSFDVNTSKMLINSDVLELIRDSFVSLSQMRNRKNRRKNKELERFLSEHHRLQQDWYLAEAN